MIAGSQRDKKHDFDSNFVFNQIDSNFVLNQTQEHEKAQVKMQTKVEDTKPLQIISPDIVISHGILWDGSNDGLWFNLAREGSALLREDPDAMIHVMTVGMDLPTHCVGAAMRGLQAHCIEPSPISERKISRRLKNSVDEGRNIQFYHMNAAAAAADTRLDLPLNSEGGTRYDTRNTKNEPNHGPMSDTERKRAIVKSIAIDDIIDNKVVPTTSFAPEEESREIDKLFLLKIDMEGLEPIVFSGLTKSIKEHKIDYLITKYWPKQIKFMHDVTEECVKPVEMLKLLADNGYSLYTGLTVSHYSAPEDAQDYLASIRNLNAYGIDYSDLVAHCKFFYEIEKLFPSSFYKRGYWTDILAVSPNARLAEEPASKLGELLQSKNAIET